jgi:hypothetical protein
MQHSQGWKQRCGFLRSRDGNEIRGDGKNKKRDASFHGNPQSMHSTM